MLLLFILTLNRHTSLGNYSFLVNIMSDGNPFHLPSSRNDGKQFDAKVVQSIFSFIST